MYLELLVDHHTSIHSLLKQLSAFTSASMLAANAEEASRAISRLAGLLTVHLAAEDKSSTRASRAAKTSISARLLRASMRRWGISPAHSFPIKKHG